MAQYQGIVVFGAVNNGWTEKYYLLASSPAGAAGNLLAVIADRLAMLHVDCVVQTAFISDVATRGDSIQIVGASEPGTAAGATGFLDLDLALLIKWQVGVYLRNKTFVRGVPLVQQLNGVWTFVSGYGSLVETWIATVLSNCVFPITTRNLTPPPNYIKASYAAATDGITNPLVARRKTGRPFGLPRGRRIAP